MIEIKGYSGSGFRFFYPWLRQVDGGHPRVIPLPKQALIQKLGLINAAVAFLVSGSLIWTRLSHAAIGSGWIYEVAVAVLLLELAWKFGWVWRTVRIETGPSPEILLAPSWLRSENGMFWSALVVSLVGMLEHSLPAHHYWWEAAMVFCLVMALCPYVNHLLVRIREPR